MAGVEPTGRILLNGDRGYEVERFLRENWLIIAGIAVMVVGYLALRTRGDKLASTAEFDTRVTSGAPTYVVFYSNT